MNLGLPGFEPGQQGPKPRILTKLDHRPLNKNIIHFSAFKYLLHDKKD